MFKCLNIDILSISISEIQYESYIIWYTRHIRNISFHRLGLCQEYVIMGFHTDFFLLTVANFQITMFCILYLIETLFLRISIEDEIKMKEE